MNVSKRFVAWSLCLAAGCLAAGSKVSAQGPPLVTGTGPEIEAHGGFEYVGQPLPTGSRLPMYGVDSGLTVGVSPHLGVRLDFGYARASDVLGTGHHSDILSYMAGPVFYPVRTRMGAVYGELLLGGARMTGVTPYTGGGYVRGFANEFAWAGGGGAEFRVGRSLSMRVGADYFRTSYFNSTAGLSGRGNMRAVVSFTRMIGGLHRR